MPAISARRGLIAFSLNALSFSCLLMLTACGGGGKGSSSSGSSGSGGTTVSSLTLTGIAANSAPLLGANIRIVDGTGNPVSMLDASGNTVTVGKTNTADGSYQLALTGTPITMPLFIQVSGRDVAGNAVVLHSLLQTSTAPVVANVSPATNAVVAELLGANPKTVFASANGNAANIAMLGNATAIGNAVAHIKLIIAANLADAKVAKTEDFFQDTTFVANKTLLDAALEGLNIRVAKDSGGKDQLQFSNKFEPAGAPDVAVDLAIAKTELSKASGTTLANAVVSTGKVTAVTTPLVNLAALDSLTTNLNKTIAQGSSSLAFASFISTTPVPPSATSTGVIPYVYNGRNNVGLMSLFGSYATNNYQISKMQVLGCADLVLTSPLKACTYYLIGATVSDSTGKPVDILRDSVTYNKATAAWTFAGNGRSTEVQVYPLAYSTLGLDGSVSNTGSSNPGLGVEVAITSQDSTGAQTMNSAITQLPSGYSVPFTYCGGLYLCASASPSTPANLSGQLSDLLLQQPALGWIGNRDGQIGAKYLITTTSGSTTQALTNYLPATVPGDVTTAQLPVLDGISTSTPLVPATILAGTKLSWNTWAAANLDARVFMVRIIVSSAAAAPFITDIALPFDLTTGVTIPAITLPNGYAPSAYQILLGAQDSLNRRFFTAYTGAAPSGN